MGKAADFLANYTGKAEGEKDTVEVVQPQATAPLPAINGSPKDVAGEIPGLDGIAQNAEEAEYQRRVGEINAHYFVAPQGGDVCIFRESTNHELGTPELNAYSVASFKLVFRNQSPVTFTDTMGNSKKTPVAEAWLNSSFRREYPNGIALLPGITTPPGVYNLYRGLGISPNPGNAEPLIRHIAQVVCGGDKVLSKYVLCWMARAVQRPDLPAEVAIVLKGGRGTGKGTLGRWLLKIFGAHGIHVLHSRHLTGNFNAHLRSCLFVFADESFFAGDRAADSVLKGLITEDTLAVESKGVDVVAMKNRLKVMMASNSDWVAPAGPDERRYCVIEVSDKQKQNHDYFAKLNEAAENGGLEALLHFLLELDLTGFNIRAVPSTKALEEQKLLSLQPFGAWLYARLSEGRIISGASYWPEKVARDLVAADFAEYVKAKSLRHVATDSATVGRQFREYFPILGEAREPTGQRRRLWVLPDLKEARRLFAESLSLKHCAWEHDCE